MWASAAERIRLTKRALRATSTSTGRRRRSPAPASASRGNRALSDSDSALGRLRTLMDAWIGLWFWPLDTGVRPPSWGEWLAVAEDLIRPDERHGLTGQLDLFDDLGSLLDAERERQQGQLTVAAAPRGPPVVVGRRRCRPRGGRLALGVRVRAEFRGWFRSHVGNPPWVRPRRREDQFLPRRSLVGSATSRPPSIKQRGGMVSTSVDAGRF